VIFVRIFVRFDFFLVRIYKIMRINLVFLFGGSISLLRLTIVKRSFRFHNLLLLQLRLMGMFILAKLFFHVHFCITFVFIFYEFIV
jgi:hypothetical protein